MKIDSKKLLAFIRKATVNASIFSAVLELDKDTLTINVLSTDTVVAVMAKLKNLKNEETVKWGIKSTRFLMSALTLFNGEIEIKQEKNILSIFNKERQVDITLAEEDFIDNKLPKMLDKIPYDKKITIPTKIMKNAVINKTAIGSERLLFEFDGKNMVVSTGGKGFDSIKETIPMVYDVCKCEYSQLLFPVIAILGDKVEFGMKTDYPMTLKEVTTDMEIVYVIGYISEPK